MSSVVFTWDCYSETVLVKKAVKGDMNKNIVSLTGLFTGTPTSDILAHSKHPRGP